jgi:hypothetical protein
VESLVKQRVYGIALGYEDLNDHDILRYDALLGLLADKEDPSGAGRRAASEWDGIIELLTSVPSRRQGSKRQQDCRNSVTSRPSSRER